MWGGRGTFKIRVMHAKVTQAEDFWQTQTMRFERHLAQLNLSSEYPKATQ